MTASTQASPGSSETSLLNALPDAVIAVDRGFRITASNAEAVARFGPEASPGNDFWAVFPDAVELARDRHYRQAMTDGSAARFEQPHSASGHWYVVRCGPIPEGMLVVLSEVSDFKRSDEAMEARGKRYRLIFELSPQAAVMYDPQTRAILMVNGAAASLYGYPRDSLVDADLLTIVADSQKQRIADLISSPKPADLNFSIQARHVRRDGTEFDVEVLSQGFVADGRPVRVIQVVDITERLRTEKARRQSEELYRTLGEAMPVLTWAMSPAGVVDYVNHRFAQVTGYSAEQIAGKGFGRLIHPEDLTRAREIWTECSKRPRPCEYQIRIRGVDGNYRWYMARLAPLLAEDGTIARWLGVAADVDELKQTQNELRLAKETAELANTRKDQFLAVLSHELRTPLTPVLLTASSLRGDPGLPEELREALDLICEQIELEAHLIDDLLDLTRITRGKFLLQPVGVDGGELVAKAIDASRSVLQAAGLSLAVDLQAGSTGLVADPKRLLQILNNLLGNAAKFTPAGGTVTVRTRDLRSDAGDQLVIDVSDTGVGIDPAVLPHIFNAFEQGEQSITRKYGGLGLGLTIGRAIAEAHGGTLSASSDGTGRGTTMTLRLPLQPSPAGESVAPKTPPPAEPGVSILLVEDNLPTLRMLSTLLSKLGHTVRAVSSPADALEAVRTFDPDLLVSDIGMPGQSGWSLLRELRNVVDPHLPAIAVSGYGTDEDLRQSKAAGFADHLVKPINAVRLQSAIADLLRKT